MPSAQRLVDPTAMAGRTPPCSCPIGSPKSIPQICQGARPQEEEHDAVAESSASAIVRYVVGYVDSAGQG